MRQFNATRLVSILFLVSIITSCSPLAVTPQPTATVLPSPTASLAPAHMVEPAFTPSPAPANTDAPAQADQAGFPSVAKMKWFDRQHGWALIGQTDYQLVRTEDGGQTWQDVMPARDARLEFPYEGTFFLDARTAWVMLRVGGNGVTAQMLYRTTDAGQTWQSWPWTFPTNPASLTFFDENNGLAGADPRCSTTCDEALYRTSNGGKTWTLYHPQPPLQVEPSFGEGTFGYSSGTTFQFKAPETIWMGGGFADYGPPQLLVSRDRGQTWQTIRFNLPESMRPVYLHLPTFFNKNDGFLSMTAALGKTPAPDGNDHQMLAIFATTDGGQSWTPLPALDTGSFTNSVQFATPTDWFADCNGALCRTNDGGQTWQALPYPEIRGGSFTLDHFFDAQNGVGFARFATPAYQDYQEIYMTHDGGQTWTRLQPVLR